jgi:hypothetical protein
VYEKWHFLNPNVHKVSLPTQSGSSSHIRNVQEFSLITFGSALSYKLEDREFDSQWCHWDYSLT